MTTPLAGLAASVEGIELRPAGLIFCVDGTSYPGAPGDPPPGGGFSSDIAYGLMDRCDGLWQHVFVGYPAAVTPMGPSVTVGANNLVAAIRWWVAWYRNRWGTTPPIVLTGYSQGAMVVNAVWLQFLLGSLKDLLPWVIRVYLFGDPNRSPGLAYGNVLAGTPMPSKLHGYVTGGISGVQDLRANETEVRAVDGEIVVKSFARDGDIYACCAVGSDPWTKMAAPGKVGNKIFKVIQQATVLDVIDVATSLFVPIGMVEEIIEGMKFAAAGVNAPHWQYWPEMNAAIDEMVLLGKTIRGY